MSQSVSALAIHTSTSNLGLCLCYPNQAVRTQTWDLGRELSSQLHDILLTFTQPDGLNQLDFIAVATGPGGFTSTRIGVVTARTLAQQLNIPLFGISSLAAVAWQWAIASPPSHNFEGTHGPAIAIQMPARRGQIFTALYRLDNRPDNCPDDPPDDCAARVDPASEIVSIPNSEPSSQGGHPHRKLKPQPFRLHPYQPAQVLDPNIWQQQLNQWPHAVKVISVEGNLGHTAIDILDLAGQDYWAGSRPYWSAVHPFYGQSPV
ncbi:MAG: tRNA (adenosine(37)-N6)-threonylcarbamoyltransferase complex dimerization subunit type 1 TsaB [Leptolyngbyaceae cyanobacterium]